MYRLGQWEVLRTPQHAITTHSSQKNVAAQSLVEELPECTGHQHPAPPCHGTPCFCSAWLGGLYRGFKKATKSERFNNVQPSNDVAMCLEDSRDSRLKEILPSFLSKVLGMILLHLFRCQLTGW